MDTTNLRDKYGRFIKGCRIATKNKGVRKPIGFGDKISKIIKGRKHSEETKIRLSILKIGNKCGLGNKSHSGKYGSKNPNWIADRSKLKKYLGSEEKRSQAYRYWRVCIFRRDNYHCRLHDLNCKGRLEAHHILGWTKNPELRYDLKNGITLCRRHHPLKREDELKLIPVFNKLVLEVN